MPKKSTFTGITSVPGSYFFDVFGQGFNYRISKSNLFQQIESEIGTPGVQSLNDLSGALQFIAGTNMSVDINEAEGTFTLNGSLSPDSIQSISFDTSAGHVVGEGELAWNDIEKTLDLGVGGGSTVQIGQEVFIRVVNQSGSTLVDGEMVYITGAQGFRPTVDRVIATSITADMTIGMVTQEIPNNGQGFITNLGIVRNLDTSGFSEGDDLWVSDVVAGGVTNVKPGPPNQSVHVGVVAREHAGLGSVFVRILKEEQLIELHDVAITDLMDGDVLVYDSATQTWVNDQASGGAVETVNTLPGPNPVVDYGFIPGAQNATLNNNIAWQGRTVGGAARNIGFISSLNETNLANTSLPTRILSNGVPKAAYGGNTYDIITTEGGQAVAGDFSQSVVTADTILHRMSNSAGMVEQQIQPDGDLVFQQRSAAGVFQNNWAVFNRNGSAIIFYNGAAKLTSEANGVSVNDTNLNVNGVNYSWTSTSAPGFMANDGSGNLSWVQAAHVDPATGTTEQVINSLIAAGIMAGP